MMPTAKSSVADHTVDGDKTTWRQRGLALLSGLIYALSFPFVIPGDEDGVISSLSRPAWVLAFVALVPMLFAVRRMSPKRAYFFSAWMLIPGTFVMLYWLMIAMNVFGHIPLVASAALLVLLCAVGWNFMGSAVAVARWLEVHRGWPALATVPLCWVGMEWWRAHVYFGGFPWGNLGTSQFNNLPVLQLGSLGGVYLIIAFIAVVNVAIYELVRFWRAERTFPRNTLVIAGGALVFTYAYGLWHISVVDELAAQAPKIKVGMLQGNIEQGIKNKDWQHQDYIIARYEKLQQRAVDEGADVVIWPEGAYPSPLYRTDETLGPRKFPTLTGASAVVGATVMWRDPPKLTGEKCRVKPMPAECRGRPWLHNSAVVITPDRRIVDRFDKTHLVPFGEYVPWPLGAVAQAIVPSLGSYVPGKELEPVNVPLVDGRAIKMGGLVCYEGIFPQYARILADRGAQLLVNITNDAWYGISSAAPQHLSFYSLRAAETGRAVARVANTGVTTMVDPVGRIRQPSKLYEDTTHIEEAPLMESRTLYTATGDVTGVAAAAGFLWALGLGLVRWYQDRRARRTAAAS